MLVAVDDEHALADRLTELLADPNLARRTGEHQAHSSSRIPA
jgi:hypothetical protein